MHQTILARQDVNKGTEVHDALNATAVDSAYFDFRSDFHHPLHRSIGRILIVGIDLHVAIVIQIDGSTGLVTDGADSGTALADNVADLLRVDLDGRDARRAAGKLFARRRDNLGHLTQDVQTCCIGLIQRNFHDLVGDALNLDVHLQSSDTVRGTRNFKVHIAEVILITQNIGQNRELVAFLDQTHGDTGHRRLDGHARVHQRQAGTTDRRHRAGTVGFSDLRYRTDGVREFFHGGHNRCHTTLGQTAVANFTTTRCTHTASFANGVRREVVVEEERVFTLTFQGIDDLHITRGTERGGHDGLGLATGKQRGTVGARQNANFHFNGANGLVVTAIDTRLAVNNLLTNDGLLNFGEVLLHFVFRRLTFVFSGQFFNGSGLDLAQAGIALHLVTDAIGLLDIGRKVSLYSVQKLSVLCFWLPLPTRLANFSGKFLDRGNRCLHFLVPEEHGAQHLVFCQALGFGFNHQNRVFSTGNHHVQQGGFQFFKGRVQEVATLIGVCDAGCTDRTIERDTGDGQGGGSGQHGGNIRILVLAGGHDRRDDLGFVHESLGKQRTNRTVNQAGRQGFFLGRTAFTLEKTTRDFAHSVGFLEVVDGQREKRLARLGFLGRNHGTQYRNVVYGDQHRAGGLAGDATGFDGDGLAAEFERFFNGIKIHGNS